MFEKEEIWKPIESHEGLYEVSSFGRVRSLDRIESYLYRGKIRKNYGKILSSVMAKFFGVSKTTISRVGLRQTFKKI